LNPTDETLLISTGLFGLNDFVKASLAHVL